MNKSDGNNKVAEAMQKPHEPKRADKPEVKQAERKPTLAEHEQKLEQYEKTGLEAACALFAIKNAELFTKTHSTFDEYCLDRWSIERAHANRLVNAAKVYTSIKDYRDENDKAISMLPRSESQIRSIYRLKQDRWEAAWLKALEISGKKHPTASQVEQVVEKMLGSKTTKAKIKIPFNEGIKEVKTRLEELREMLKGMDAQDEFNCVQEILDLVTNLIAPSQPEQTTKMRTAKTTKNLKA